MCVCSFFFFKQKTAYEMRISDWSSDVCSSDLITHRFVDKTLDFVERSKDRAWFAQLWLTDMHTPWVPSAEQLAATKGKGATPREDQFLAVLVAMDAEIGRLVDGLRRAGELDDTLIVFRSEEHTSELQSLMRISYAVFCLKKTKQKT